MFKILLLSLSITSFVFGQKIRYDGYRFICITPKTKAHVDFLVKLKDETDVNFWSHVKGINEDVFVSLSSKSFLKYEKLFMAENISFKIVIDDMQKQIDLEERSMVRTKMQTRDIVGKYATFDEILQYINRISSNNPYVRVYNAGFTVEGRTIPVVNINTGSTRRSLWFDCGIHAREWIAISTCIWIIDRLTNDYSRGNTDVVDLLNYYDVHVMPVHNPDGYVYSRLRDRYWRKNRAPNPIPVCPGVDLNRNYGYQWYTGGSSLNPCSDTYTGPYADSEPETQALQNTILSKLGDWDAYVTFHAFGLYFTHPNSYTTNPTPDFYEHTRVSNIVANAIKSVNGTSYRTGSTASQIYIASGTSQDWAYSMAKIKHSYTVELRPDINDVITQFLLPESEAPAVGEEIYQGMLALMKTLKVS